MPRISGARGWHMLTALPRTIGDLVRRWRGRPPEEAGVREPRRPRPTLPAEPGQVPSGLLPRGRSADTWIDWNLDGHNVPVPHFGLVLPVPDFHRCAERPHAAGTRFGIEPYVRFAGEVGEQWTMFFYDPAGNAVEFKAFADESQLFVS
jgi:extradiol dioxygenase family protein